MKYYISKLKKFVEFKEEKQAICPLCKNQLEKHAVHTCDSNINLKTGDGTIEQQRERFKEETLQPYTEDGKVNNDFIKVYGKNKHPQFNKEIMKGIK